MEKEINQEESIKVTDEKSKVPSSVSTEMSEKLKMELSDELDDISEGEVLPSDKELEVEKDSPKEVEEGEVFDEEEEEVEVEALPKVEVKESVKPPTVESAEPNLSVKKEIIEHEIVDSNLSKPEVNSVVQEEIKESEAKEKEASERLMELASIFADYGRQAVLEPAVEVKEEAVSKVDMTPEASVDQKLKISESLTNGELDYSTEATLSADETRMYENMCSDEELINRRDLHAGSIASQLISEHSYCLPQAIRTESPVHVGSNQNFNSVESVIESVARGPKQIVADHEYTKIRESSPQFIIPPSPPKVMPRRKTKLKRRRRSSRTSIKETYTEDIKQSVTQPEFVFPKRSVMEELNILYEFLRNGIDQEDTVYLQRSYDALLQDDAQGFWLNDTHWVDHPDILFIIILINLVLLFQKVLLPILVLDTSNYFHLIYTCNAVY